MFRKKADEFIKAHDEEGGWLPFTRDEKASIQLFAESLDAPRRPSPRALDPAEQEIACAWDNVSSPDFDGCNGCKYSCALGLFPNRSAGK